MAVRRYVVTSHTKERFIEEATRQQNASQGIVGSGADVMSVTARATSEVPGDELGARRTEKQESPNSPPLDYTLHLQFLVAGLHHAGGFAFYEDDVLGFNFVAVFTEDSDEVSLDIII